VVEPDEELFQPECGHPGGRQLDRQGKAVNAVADLTDERPVGVVRPERAVQSGRTPEEQRGGVVLGQRPNRHHLLTRDA
jgi:hypothetical protein